MGSRVNNSAAVNGGDVVNFAASNFGGAPYYNTGRSHAAYFGSGGSCAVPLGRPMGIVGRCYGTNHLGARRLNVASISGRWAIGTDGRYQP